MSFLLSGTGKVEKWKVPQGSVEFCLPESLEGIRVDSGVRGGDEVGVHYDPMIAKVIAGGRDRAAALQNLNKALQELQVHSKVRKAILECNNLLSQPNYSTSTSACDQLSGVT